MVEPRRLHRFSYAEYVQREMYSDEKHEFLDGDISLMGGGSEEHAALAFRIARLLDDAIGERPCRGYSADLRIYVESARLATFPDVSVICGPVKRHEPGPETTALNPTILVEVTSPSSEEYDLGFKRQSYLTIPSLREYVIVSYRERRITVDVRNADGSWTTRTATRGERVELPSLDTQIAVDDVYRKSAIA